MIKFLNRSKGNLWKDIPVGEYTFYRQKYQKELQEMGLSENMRPTNLHGALTKRLRPVHQHGVNLVNSLKNKRM